ncbi:MAG: hypothetical protein OHK0017_03390 [Patescibacteria group bacterium]
MLVFSLVFYFYSQKTDRVKIQVINGTAILKSDRAEQNLNSQDSVFLKNDDQITLDSNTEAVIVFESGELLFKKGPQKLSYTYQLDPESNIHLHNFLNLNTGQLESYSPTRVNTATAAILGILSPGYNRLKHSEVKGVAEKADVTEKEYDNLIQCLEDSKQNNKPLAEGVNSCTDHKTD